MASEMHLRHTSLQKPPLEQPGPILGPWLRHVEASNRADSNGKALKRVCDVEGLEMTEQTDLAQVSGKGPPVLL